MYCLVKISKKNVLWFQISDFNMFERYFGTTTKLHVLPQGRSKTKTPFHQNSLTFFQTTFSKNTLHQGTIKKTPQLLRLDNSGYFLKPPHLPHTSCISHHVIKWNPTLSGVLVWSCRLAGNYFPNCCGCRTAAQRKLYKHDLRYIDAICRNLLRSLVGAPAGLDWLSPWHDMHGMSACEIRWRFMVWNFGRKHVVCNIGNSETRKIFDTWVRNYVFLPIQRVWYLEDFAATTDIWMQCASKFVVLANCWPRILVASVLPHPPKKKQKKMRLKWATSGHTNGNWKWKFPRWRKQMKLHIPGASTHADFHVFNLGFKI